ncbi:MAG TPA: hypothetical protein VFO76_09490 [Candidatus Kapabacteria bacterium]|nr:hypothetical protein [Candidatus Kapabacteria bacterium]
MKRLLLAFLSIAIPVLASAQDTMRTRYGIEGSVGQNNHETDFRALPGVPNCCPQFASGKASGFSFDLLYERPISDLFFAGVHIGYIAHDGQLQGVSQPTTVFLDSMNKPGSYSHSLSLLAGSVGIEPRIGARFFDHILVSAGLRVGLLMKAHYSQFDKTSQGLFLDSLGNSTGSAYRDQSSGILPNTNSPLLHGVFSLAGEFAADKEHTFYVAPEISFLLALNDLIKDVSWKVNALKFGIAFKYSPQPRNPQRDSELSNNGGPYAMMSASHKRILVPATDIPYSFTKSPYISPKIVKDLSSWNSEGGDQVVEINLTQSQNSERYRGRIDSMKAEGKPTFVYWFDQTKKKTIRPVYFGYEFIGTTTNGTLVLHTSDCNGDSTVLHYLMLVTFVRDSGLAYDVATSSMTGNPWIGIKKIGEIPLGKDWKGKVGIEGNRIFVAETSALFEKHTGRVIDVSF